MQAGGRAALFSPSRLSTGRFCMPASLRPCVPASLRPCSSLSLLDAGKGQRCRLANSHLNFSQSVTRASPPAPKSFKVSPRVPGAHFHRKRRGKPQTFKNTFPSAHIWLAFPSHLCQDFRNPLFQNLTTRPASERREACASAPHCTFPGHIAWVSPPSHPGPGPGSGSATLWPDRRPRSEGRPVPAPRPITEHCSRTTHRTAPHRAGPRLQLRLRLRPAPRPITEHCSRTPHRTGGAGPALAPRLRHASAESRGSDTATSPPAREAQLLPVCHTPQGLSSPPLTDLHSSTSHRRAPAGRPRVGVRADGSSGHAGPSVQGLRSLDRSISEPETLRTFQPPFMGMPAVRFPPF